MATLHFITFRNRSISFAFQVVLNRHRLNRSSAISILILVRLYEYSSLVTMYVAIAFVSFLHWLLDVIEEQRIHPVISSLFFRKRLLINAIQRNHALRKHVQRLKADCILSLSFSASHRLAIYVRFLLRKVSSRSFGRSPVEHRPHLLRIRRLFSSTTVEIVLEVNGLRSRVFVSDVDEHSARSG